jgi:hypothetical protein
MRAPESLWEGQLRRTALSRTSSGSLIRGRSDLLKHVLTVREDDTSGRHTERLPIHAWEHDFANYVAGDLAGCPLNNEIITCRI